MGVGISNVVEASDLAAISTVNRTLLTEPEKSAKIRGLNWSSITGMVRFPPAIVMAVIPVLPRTGVN